ncbi:hypothetical protein DHW03_03580 [Pedobacter yonginense]|uniref:Uncharacterized protein n=1 Tax=Pedobacter yonginense TaxID=651869 RepID=A0A317EUT1_9SPHI|nr:hypothetical protein DHW03_03580 [Pedobacter yonginense]
MGHLKIYDTNIDKASIAAEREYTYLKSSSEHKILALLNLNRTSVALNGGSPLKKPQGLGLVIRRSNL